MYRACNFISLTNCSSRELSLNSSKIGIIPVSSEISMARNMHLKKDNRIKPFLKSLAIDDKLRNEYQDSPWLPDDIWLQSRLYAFQQRPNYQLRREIQKSLRSIIDLRQLYSSQIHSSQLKMERQHGDILRIPHCLAMHVRHNDATLDSRSIDYTDRSLDAHVRIFQNHSFTQGLENIFLATDNLTIVAIASVLYPQFNWYTQQRPMSAEVGLYKMFTQKIEIFDITEKGGQRVEFDGNSTNSITYSVQKDLAHIIADLRFASRCDALVGSFDSRMTNLIHILMCSMKGIEDDGKFPIAINVLDGKAI